MFPPTTRRDFFRALAGAAGLSLSNRAFAQHSSATITAERLSDNVLLITGAGANVVAVTGPDGILLVNGGLAERSASLLTAVAERSATSRVAALFNTDWNPENTGSNETAGKAGAKIIAHENTKLWLGTEIDVAWQHRTYKPLPSKAIPNETFYTTGKLTFGKEQIMYGHLGQAHTDGDIYVFLPGPNILVTGDVFCAGKYPIPDYCTGGWLGGLVTATKTLTGLADANTRVIPGSGPVQKRGDLEAQYEMCSKMKDRFVELMKAGKGNDEIIAAAPTAEFDKTWGNPDVFVSVAYRGLWAHVRELGGIV